MPRPLTTTEQGYGYTHQQARKQAIAQHHPANPCCLCGHPLGPAGPWLHLDHHPNKQSYRGLAHGSKPCPDCGKTCNTRDGAIRGNQARGRTTSRRW